MASNERRLPANPMRQEHGSLQIKDASIFSIMQLPVELRQKIWKSVMVFDGPIPVEPHGRILSAPSHLRSGRQVKIHIIEQELQRLSSQFALASTCRQVYLEVAPIYYGMNTFTVPSKYLVRFLNAIGAENIRSLTSVQWVLSKLLIHWQPTLSLHLDEKRLPFLRSLRDSLKLLPGKRTCAPLYSPDVKEILKCHPWLDLNLPEHQGWYCHPCALDMRVYMNHLSGASI
jgi:hypothetical protein